MDRPWYGAVGPPDVGALGKAAGGATGLGDGVAAAEADDASGEDAPQAITSAEPSAASDRRTRGLTWCDDALSRVSIQAGSSGRKMSSRARLR